MIDDLVKFCLTEVAYEGELGCTIDRLKELISRFSETSLASSSLNPPKVKSDQVKEKKKIKQNVDDTYCTYVYSLIVKHPSIVIGTVPDGTPPVWIAPPPHKKGQAPLPPPVSLDVIEGAKEKSMGELKETYGSQLRIAADKMACFVALTGSHNRSSRLSDTVYTTLQIITRSRDKGIPVKDIGPITKYDPKSIFYQIAQLVDMGLVVKVMKGPSLNWAVLKKFFERSHLWQRIMGESKEQPQGNDGAGSDQAETFGENDDGAADLVANVPLLRYRVLKLVEGATNQIHQYNNIIVSAGFINPVKSQRRFFTSRLNEMIEEGLLDKLAVPTGRGSAICVKLTDKGRDLLAKPGSRSLDSEFQSPDNILDENVMQADVEDEEFMWTKDTRPLRGIGLQRQLIGLLDANPGGLVIREMSTALGIFDRRTIEQVLTRLCTRVPPRHLADLHPVTVMETEGKIRRQRYFTIKHYRQLLQDQNLQDDRYNWLHMDDVGDFSYVVDTMFWKTPAELSKFISTVQDNRGKISKSKPTTSKAPRKKEPKNPVIDGVVKRGRPRKEWSQPTKRKATELEFVFEDGNPAAKAGHATDQASKPSKSRKKKKTDQPANEPGPVEQAQDTAANPEGDSPPLQTVPTSDSRGDMSMTHANVTIGGDLTVSPATVDTPVKAGTAVQSAATRKAASKAGTRKAKKRTVDEVDGTEPIPPAKRQKKAMVPSASNKEPQVLVISASARSDIRQAEATAAEPAQEIEPVMETPQGEASTSHELLHRSPIRPHKRFKQQKPRATNVSELRRQQEILDVLLANDGIMQLNTEMAIHLRDHVQELAESGVQTGQSVGFLSDKKTISRAVTALEEREQVKVIKTVIVDPNRRGSLQQPTTIIYLPETSQEKVQDYLASLQKPYKPTQVPAIPVPVTAIAFSKSIKRKVPTRDESPVSGVDTAAVIGPRQQFLEDRQTVAQLFGFLLGKSRRAQELYLFTLSHILSDSPSPTVISVEERIVSTNYWTEDYPLGSFCAIIPTQVYIPHLEAAQNDPEALNEPLKSLDTSLRRALKTKHARARIRLVEIFHVLHAIQLISPLKEDSGGPIIVPDARSETVPKRFVEVEMPSGSNPTPPTFWRFNKKAPIWLFALAKFTSQTIETEPPFYKNLTLSTVEDAMTYWSILQRVCDRQTDFTTFDTSNANALTAFPISPSTLASLCSYRGWTADYRLSKLQEEYLKEMVDARTLTTPLSDPTPERLMQAAFITCAPQQVICAYFAAQAEKLEGAFARIERRKQKHPGPLREALQNSLAQKAQRHLQDIGAKWDQLVQELVDGELSPEDEEKLLPLRSRYITVGGMVDEDKLKELIEAVVRNPVESVRKRYQKSSSKATQGLAREIQIEDVEKAMPQPARLFHPSRAVPSRPSQPLGVTGFPLLPPFIAHQTAKSVSELIQGMGEDEGPRPKRKKGPAKKGDGPKEVVTRRKRFHWNEEYDELLRDTVAVIRARCRERSRGIAWPPAEQVFPTLGGNNLRTHFSKYVTQPGAASYMDRLERGWYNLWQMHKGRPELPDEDPTNPAGCDLVTHVQFLRSYLDKRKLLANVEEDKELSPVANSNSQPDLPLDIGEIHENFRVEEHGTSSIQSILLQYWGDLPAYLNERTHTISAFAFAERQTAAPQDVPLEQSVAESAIQMIVATEQESYREDVATTLLVPFGDELVKKATHALWKRGTISKISKTKVGRGYRMSEPNMEELSGKVPLQRIEDAAAVETVFHEDPDEWRAWSINASEGEMAALLCRASRHEAEFKIQVPDMKMARDIAHWTSRKIQDDMLESHIEVLFSQPELESSTPLYDEMLTTAGERIENDVGARVDIVREPKAGNAEGLGHGKTVEKRRASCAIIQGAGQLLNCAKCLHDARDFLLAKISSPSQKDAVLALLAGLENAGTPGLTAEDVWARIDAVIQSSPGFSSATHRLVNCDPPLAFWSGYTRSCLVSTNFLGYYAVWLPSEHGAKDDNTDSEAHLRLVMPRRWVDLNGKTVFSTWKSALRAVVGLLLCRASMNHNRLLEHFNKVYDRLDMLAVLQYLEDEGAIKMVGYPGGGSDEADEDGRIVGQMTLEEEGRTFWELERDFEWQTLL